MNNRPVERRESDPFEVLAVSVLGFVATIAALHWAAAALALFLRRRMLLRTSGQELIASARRLPDNLGDPAASWTDPLRSQLPGPILYWFSIVVVMAVVVVAFGLYLHWRRPMHEPPDQRRRLGVDTQARLATTAELMPLVGRGPEPNRLILTQWGKRRVLMTEPERVRGRRGVRGAVAVFGPTQSGKTTGLTRSVTHWQGPAIVSSVKTDLMHSTIEARRRAGDVRVFDPQGISGLPSATWSPLRRARTRDGALTAANILCKSAGDEGSTDRFWRQQAEQLLAAMMWIAANADGYTMRHVVDWVLTLDRPVGDEPGTLSPLVRLLTDHPDPEVARNAQEVRSWLTGQWNADPKTSASIYTTARSAIWPWTDSGVARSAEDCEITLDWLLDGGNTLYLVAPLGGEQRLGKVFAAMLQDLITEAFERSNRVGPIDPGLLLLLDEAANTALPDLPEWAATVTGVGVQLVTVWQSKGQLDRVYGKDADNLLNNHRTKMLYPSSVSDRQTTDYFRELVGDEHIRSDLENPRAGRGVEVKERRAPSTAVPYLTPAVLRQMKVGDCLLFHGSLPPAWIKARK